MPVWARRKSKPNLGIGIDWRHPLSQGLVQFWPFNEGQPVSARDIVSGATATVGSSPPTASSGPDGAALTFGSGTNTGLITTEFMAPAAWTLAVKLQCASGGYRSAYTDSAGNAGLFINSLTPDFYTSGDHNASSAIAANTWTTIVLSYDGTTGRWYIDGVPAGTYTASTPWNNISFIGGKGAGNGLTGSISWLGLWNRVLAAQEVSAFTANPWQIFESPRIQWLYKAGSTIGGSATLSAATGVFGFSGNAANLLAGRVLGASPGSYGLTGQAAALLSGRVLPAATGAFAFTGIDAGLLAGRVLTASTGVYTVTGNNAGLLAGRVIVASTGVYVLTGNAANLVFSGQPGAFTLVAETGTFALTGNAAGLLAGRVLTAAPGSYALSSVGASLMWSGHITPSFIDPDEVTMITP